ncbi:hypothetical protein [Sigmofec virus UA08Rod_5492]|uniref:Uncharacterized protein n=1 Tax=Sigmofec virus UA08Rod_5492 TaxID=2929426 RepID=A0A976R8K6_9VIRU|nr:hypothetical protein [Sigmofec virus UA08Rod_5492]
MRPIGHDRNEKLAEIKAVEIWQTREERQQERQTAEKDKNLTEDQKTDILKDQPGNHLTEDISAYPQKISRKIKCPNNRTHKKIKKKKQKKY